MRSRFFGVRDEAEWTALNDQFDSYFRGKDEAC